MNRFFNAISSAIFVTEEETAKQQPTQQPQAVPQPQATTALKQAATTVAQPQAAAAQAAVPAQQQTLDTELLDKLCERLEKENIPGPDYMELKTAVNDEEMVSIIPDEGKRFIAAFKSLKANAPTFSKKTVTDSIDHYVSKLEEWRGEALGEIAASRKGVEGKKQEIAAIAKQIEDLRKKSSELESQVAVTEERCAANEANMNAAVSFLVSKLQGDKTVIESVLKD